MTTQQQTMSEADEMFGYAFGCDGLMSPAQACEFLAVSRDTVDRLADAGKIRKGKPAGGHMVRFCRRSILNFAQSIEV